MILAFLLGLAYCAMLLPFVVALATAPYGYEDAEGFHYGKEPAA